MSDTVETTGRDPKTGQYKVGHIGHGGRPRGARSKLGEAFVQDLQIVWEETGIDALRRCAAEEPAQFVRVLAMLLPKDISLTLSVDATAFADKFATAMSLLGNEPEERRMRPMLPNQRTIEHDDG